MKKRAKRVRRTPWYPASMVPENPGPYECERSEKSGTVIRMLNWDGEHWRYGDDVPNEHCKPGMIALMHPDYGDRWRGVVQS
ncbi:hypothetical protein [Paraburkholderia terrae]|uniref:hypothetical protein n=1 Tax=Paraburkholderia terrae TaxID=311230 RepID=UPI001EE317B4|nr:hypothetical protein [Paraburkholderia terrae]GJH00243.1 hypothetical protein CBA19C8_06820 [Paraburkholderia terrae]